MPLTVSNPILTEIGRITVYKHNKYRKHGGKR